MMFISCVLLLAAVFNVNGLPNPQLFTVGNRPHLISRLSSGGRLLQVPQSQGIQFVQQHVQPQPSIVAIAQPSRAIVTSNQQFSPANEVSSSEFVLNNSEPGAQLRADNGDIVDPNASYTLRYHVQDPLSGDNKEVAQSGTGSSQSGTYSVVHPDGSVRRTEWSSDDVNGYTAVVTTNNVDGTVEVRKFPEEAPQPVQAIRRNLAETVQIQAVPRPAQPVVLTNNRQFILRQNFPENLNLHGIPIAVSQVAQPFLTSNNQQFVLSNRNFPSSFVVQGFPGQHANSVQILDN